MVNLPNYITITRIILVPFFFIFLVYCGPEHSNFRILSTILFLFAMATDAVDGLIARKFRFQTQLGTFLDPFADKLLLLSGFLGIIFSEALELKPPLWIIIVIIFRDVFIICGLVIIYLAVNKIEIKPNLLGKVTTFFQMLTILSILIQYQNANLIWNVTIFFTILSWLAYIWQGIGFLNAQSKKP